MQTALHIMALAAQLRQEVIGGDLNSVEYYRKERTVHFVVKCRRNRLALYFSYHPTAFGSYLVPASKLKIETREKPRPAFELAGAVVVDIEQVGFDRILRMRLERDGAKRVLLIEALGPNGNIWLLDGHDVILSSLRRRDFAAGAKYRLPAPPAKLSPLNLTASDLRNLVEQRSDSSIPVAMLLERHVLGFDPLLAREVEARGRVGSLDSGSVADDSRSKIIEVVGEIVARFRSPETGYLYQTRQGVSAYPLKLTSTDQQPERFKSLSLAVQAMTLRRRTLVAVADEQKSVSDAVARAVKRLQRRLHKIEHDLHAASDYEKHRRFGELLQINFDRIKKGSEEITVEDIYTDSQEPIAIALDPALSPSANVEAYFRKHRKGRDGLALLQRRLEITRQELAQLEMIRSELEHDFDSARQRYEPEIAPMLPAEIRRRDEAPRLPYREHTLSTGVRVFVGRGGADNDRTTFEYARPYELWFHAQQCPGSHVVMKFPNKSFEPSRMEIEEAAALAAYHSKARKDSMVPVIYTERKYVRKPRKAKPGLVTVEREKSVMVEPGEPN